MTSSPSALQRISTSSRGARMGAWLVGMGVLHFAAPKPFDTIVPEELPGSARFYTYASGVAEVGVGGLLLVPATRRVGALSAIALFVGVFPGNANMVRMWFRDPTKNLAMRLGAIARLPLQVPMITQAWKIYKES
ncbi:DoxX family protein [Mycolicibacterium gilvum]|uniref:DoxX family protein n=1 Tax=Mycolicibacterium gilvum TaxID=1804 RepID=UPI0040455AE8